MSFVLLTTILKNGNMCLRMKKSKNSQFDTKVIKGYQNRLQKTQYLCGFAGFGCVFDSRYLLFSSCQKIQ